MIILSKGMECSWVEMSAKNNVNIGTLLAKNQKAEGAKPSQPPCRQSKQGAPSILPSSLPEGLDEVHQFILTEHVDMHSVAGELVEAVRAATRRHDLHTVVRLEAFLRV